jgi:hypothetical protein
LYCVLVCRGAQWLNVMRRAGTQNGMADGAASQAPKLESHIPPHRPQRKGRKKKEV